MYVMDCHKEVKLGLFPNKDACYDAKLGATGQGLRAMSEGAARMPANSFQTPQTTGSASSCVAHTLPRNIKPGCRNTCMDGKRVEICD